MAISTSIENSAGPITPACKPMLMMMSSMSPREFMSAPIPRAVRLSCPDRRAAAQQAPNFARIEAVRIPAAIKSSDALLTIVSCVFRPE